MIDNAYISVNPNIAFGKPCIAGTHISVELLLEFLSHGHTIDNLLDYYPQLTREQIQAAIDFARGCVRCEYSQEVVGQPRRMALSRLER
jgi:uncharacterized protein (DUF433 family)